MPDRRLEVRRQPYGVPGTIIHEADVPNQEMVEMLIARDAYRVVPPGEKPNVKAVPYELAANPAAGVAPVPVTESTAPLPDVDSVTVEATPPADAATADTTTAADESEAGDAAEDATKAKSTRRAR